MSSIGLSEWVLLALIGLIVLGPERLPRIANQIGGWLGQARRMTRVMKRQLEEELDFEKTNSIKPKSSRPAPVPPEDETPDPEAETTHLPANEDDDTFSPAHDAESIGTGVADDEGVEAEEAEEAEEADDDLVPDDTYIVENKKDTNP